VLRLFAGILWLANLGWKLPPDFGKDDPEGLLYNFQRAEQHAVFGFLQTFMRDVVIPHFTLFGAIVFTVELVAGALLTLGLLARLGGLIGTVQAVIITLLVVRAPHEWFWTYAMLTLLNAICLLAVTDDRLTVRQLSTALKRRQPGSGTA